MDTRYWGPDGWNLLHLSAAIYMPKKRQEYNEWLSTLPYILPCKFCRASLISYYEEIPPDYTSAKTLSKWVWQIHGKVNDKLRGQGQNIHQDPPFMGVYTKYMKHAKDKCPDIWRFLFSTAFQHPRSTKSLPMPDAPMNMRACDLSEPDKCRWNIMCATEKMPYFRRFWKALPTILPDIIAIKWYSALLKNPMQVENKWQTLKWLYKQYTIICGSTSVSSFPAIIDDLKKHSSDCNKSITAKTCRMRPKKTAASKRTVKNRH